jgi:small subunit ribosomal protein S17e
MGRIRSKDIKRVSFSIVKNNPQHFGNDFEENKAKINEMKRFEEKKMRNRVAGYVTRIAKRFKKQ